jgi:hypothetical protein
MTAFDKFEKFGQKIYNGQDVLKNHILNKYPVHLTDDTDDYEQIKSYDSEFVWLVDKNIETLRSFPWWFKPSEDQKDSIHLFPYVYKNSKRIKSWHKVKLIPTEIKKEKFVNHNHICGVYDVYNGHDKFDLFFLGNTNTDAWLLLNERFPEAVAVNSYQEAQTQSKTNMFWLVPDDVSVSEFFKFSYQPDDWSQDYTHVFGNGKSDLKDGIALFPKHYNPTEKELTHRYYINKKELKVIASKPIPYSRYSFSNYKEYQLALENSPTDLFWYVPDDVEIVDETVFDLYFEHQNQYDRKINHVFLNGDSYDGIVLFSKHAPVTTKEFTHRFYANKKEHEVVASCPKKYDQFVVNTYADYKQACEHSSTEMFWGIPSDVTVDNNFKFDLYFSHHNNYDRNITHVFKNDSTYDGVVLYSKNTSLTEREVNFRFYSQKKEWDIVASVPKPYDIFCVDSYEEYLSALENSSADLFWVSSRNIKILDLNLLDNFYISHHEIVDRKQNHVFYHNANDNLHRNGVMLLSKHKPLSKREIEHRFPALRKEWNLVLSGPVDYSVFTVENYNDYLTALETSKTEMFWAVTDNVDYNIPSIYFTHDNEFDRKQNHAFIHRVNNKDLYNGIFLLSKHKPLTEREINYRHPVERKEWNIVASGPIGYEIFDIDSYEDYLNALEHSTTEMFWGISKNINCEKFDFALYFSHDNEYDRNTNHTFIHRVNDSDYKNGVFLFSKHALVTANEIEHRFLVNAKDWDIVASGPVEYEIWDVDTYQEYTYALNHCETEMFWAISRNIDTAGFDFSSVYFIHDNVFDRTTNHCFAHLVDDKKHYNGVMLLSKHAVLSENEIKHRFPVNRKEWDIVASKPVKYDYYEIDSYEDYLDAINDAGTELFWMSSRNISLDKNFDLSSIYFTHDNEYDRTTNHSFVHNVDGTNYRNGLFLCSKHTILSEREIEYRHLVNAKEWNIVASGPVEYDKFIIETYDDYLKALENTKTEMFWGLSRNVDYSNFNTNLYFTHDNTFDRNTNHAFLHCGNKFNGIFLFSSHAPVSKKEIEHRHLIEYKEWTDRHTTSVNYDVFEIDNYNEYLNALENSTTEMFWMSSRNISATIPNLYFTHDNEFDRKINHNFLHCGKRNGVFLMSKQSPVTQREIDYRHLVNAKEWDIEASTAKAYDVFVIDSYDEYLNALENSTTEMFWMTSRNLVSTLPDLYFTHDNEFDRKINHSFLHFEKRNGVFLCSKYNILTQKEVEHRHAVNSKEWNITASLAIVYDKFVIDNYSDYLEALENTKTEMFWGIPSDVIVNPNFTFDLYFTHDNEYDRKTTHVMLNGEHRDGIVLFSKHAPVTQKEVENRFYLNKKDWDILASTPKPYEFYNIVSYNDYLEALENSPTELFWASTPNIKINKDFDADLYFSHHNTYDRSINHTFVHRVDGEDHYNGLFLLTKRAPLTEKEIEYRLIAKRKSWDIVASGPVEYEKFIVDTYEDYETARNSSETEMFWMIPPEVNVDPNFKFDLYFTHNQWFERKTTHMFKNDTAWDGISLISKTSQITEREIRMRFFANKKQYDIIASRPIPYDIVFISNDEEHADINYQKLVTRFPRAKRVHGVKGIHQAHIEAARLCETDMFWVVDADAEIIEKFEFDYYVPSYDPDGRKTVHVWKAQNPINNLVYGYGAVKLLPRQLTLNMDTSKPDMTTSISSYFKPINRISNITNFNTDEFSTWRSAFRECVKLASRSIDGQLDEETEFRLKIWCTRGKDKPFGEFCIAGANAGKVYGESHRGNLQSLAMINNFEWLSEQFKKLNQ